MCNTELIQITFNSIKNKVFFNKDKRMSFDNEVNELQRLINEYSDDDIDIDVACSNENKCGNVVDEKLSSLIEHRLRHGLTMRCTIDAAKMMNQMPGADVLVPETKKKIKHRSDVQFQCEYFVICRCENIVKDGELCSNRNTRVKKNSKTNNFIVSFPLVPQIKSALSTHYSEITEYLNREHEHGVLADIDDGTAFKNIAAKYPNVKILGLTMNIDGAAMYRSSKGSLWITQIYQNYLPPNMRYRPENILIVSLFYGVKKPNVFQLLSQLAMELDDCEITVFNGDQFENFVPTIVTASCDLPARAMLQNFKGPVGRFSCPMCYHPGVPVLNLKGTTTIRYLKQNEHAIRKHNETVQKAIAINDQKDSIDGIKGQSCMLLFNHFDIIDGFATDFMHGVALGVVKDIFQIWLGIRKIPVPNNSLKIKLKNMNEKNILNRRITQLKPTMNFKRKPRSIFEIHNYKATEFLNFLLYYSRFALMNLLPIQVIKHFELLSAATFILCKSSITNAEVQQANAMLNEFADKFEIIYGKVAITMNVHLLRHYGRVVSICGPLWSNSLFGFESNIGVIKKFLCGPTDILQQISEKYVISKELMKPTYDDTDSDENVYQPKSIILSEEYTHVLSAIGMPVTPGKFTIYRRFKSNGRTYTSVMCQETKSADFFLQLDNGIIGTAEFYFKNGTDMFVLVNKHIINYTHFHIKEVTKLDEYDIFPCNQIRNKILFLSVCGIKYISDIPNAYFV